MFLRSSFSGVHMPTLAQENNYLKNVNCTEICQKKTKKYVVHTYTLKKQIKTNTVRKASSRFVLSSDSYTTQVLHRSQFELLES